MTAQDSTAEEKKIALASYLKRWREDNKEKRKAYAQDYYKANRDKMQEKMAHESQTYKACAEIVRQAQELV